MTFFGGGIPKTPGEVHTYRMALTSGELLCSPAGFIGLIGFELEILFVTFAGAGTGLRSFRMVATGTCGREFEI